MIDFQELWQLNRKWRQWMEANSEFVTPDTIDTLRYCRIECNEAADVELRNRLSKHPRNNGRDNTAYEELADALMLALTAIPEGIDWYSRESTAALNSPAEHMDRICAWANRAVIYHTDDFGIAQSERVEALVNLCSFVYWYPGMNTEAELRKCWHRLAWKHASKAMDSYPEELKTMSKIHEQDNNTVALIDGQLYYYDACSAFRDVYNPAIFDYIGQGVIHSYRGIPRDTGNVKHFWRYKDRTLLQPEGTL